MAIAFWAFGHTKLLILFFFLEFAPAAAGPGKGAHDPDYL
jgi:hypothetical protein